ncbi:MAG: hypothetical protein AAGG68_03225 [Bacteroidota bacterium]
MRLILLFTFILFYFTFFSQTPKYKVISLNSGLSITSITRSNIQGAPFGALSSLSGSLTYEHYYENGLFLGTALFYNPRGEQTTFTWTDQNGKITGDGKTKFQYNYVSLPLKVGYYFGNKFLGVINGGILPSYLVSLTEVSKNIYTIDGELIEKAKETTSDIGNFNRFDLAGIVELSIGRRVGKRLWIIFSASYQHSFTNITDQNIFNLNSYHYGVTSALGVKYLWKWKREDKVINAYYYPGYFPSTPINGG